MDQATLFGKLQDDEIKLKRHTENEEGDKNKKYFALKVEKPNNKKSDEDMNILVNKFKKTITHEKTTLKFPA